MELIKFGLILLAICLILNCLSSKEGFTMAAIMSWINPTTKKHPFKFSPGLAYPMEYYHHPDGYMYPLSNLN